MRDLSKTIRAIRMAKGLNQTEFGKLCGVKQSTVTRWESGSVPNGEMLQKIAKIGETTVEKLIGEADFLANPINTIPVVGFVGAGAAIFPYDDYARGDGLDHIERPPFIKGDAVAVEVKGDSLLPVAENGWRLVYVGDQTTIESEILNRLCVVKLEDGRTLVKRVMRGSSPGSYHLASTNAPMIEDVAISWASPVKAIIPT
jgi:repressor LexA